MRDSPIYLFYRRNARFFLVLPCILVLALLILYPIIYTITLSFHKWHLLEGAREADFIGFGNYLSLFKSNIFWDVFKVTIIFSTSTITVEFFFGLMLALLLDTKLIGVKIVRILVLIPMIIAPIVIGFIWKLLLHMERGHVNYFLSLVGIPGVKWLSNPSIVLITVILVDVWKWSPLVMLILLAGLQSIPREIYEAGKVDGVGDFQAFRYLTLPMLKPYIMVAVIIRLIDSFKTFDYLLFLTGGGPGRATEILNLFIYYTGFRHYHMGSASALAVIIVFLALVSGILVPKLIRREER